MSGSPSLKVHGMPLSLKRRNKIGRGPGKLKQSAPSWKASWIGRGILASESGFSTRIRKRVADLEDESTPISDGKRPRRSSPDEEA